MKVVILCGGKGTRLKEKTESMPKPLIEIGGRSILWHIMNIYKAQGFKEFVLCLGYKGQMIRECFEKDMNKEGWKIEFAETGEDTQTGGRVKKIESFIRDENFMLTYGDGVSDIDLSRLVQHHQKHGKIGTVTAVNPPSQFGLLEIQGNSHVSSFREKPTTDQWINGGFFVFKKDFFKYLTEEDVLEKKPLERLAKEDQLVAFQHRGYWKCMDTYKDTIALNEIWGSGKAPWAPLETN